MNHLKLNCYVDIHSVLCADFTLKHQRLFFATGNHKFLGDNNPKIQKANWLVLIICVVLVNLPRVFELDNAFATWVVNVLLCVVTTVFTFLATSCCAMAWELFKSFRQALKESERV